jgi:BirA family biotin operon repressor/biotin-[acetyl-CoA-carboxylase] ligase
MGGGLTLVSAVAVCEAVRAATEVTPTIKWPNDLLIGGKKLAGVLVESRLVESSRRGWVIGIGINCLQHAGHFPDDLRDAATSLELAASHPVERVEVARHLLQSLDAWLTSEPDEQRVREAWYSFASPLGQPVRLRKEGHVFSGRTVEVDPSGGLVVQCDDGRREWFDPMLTTSV